MADTNLMKNCSVLFPMTISGADILIFFFGRSSASTRDGKATKYLYNAVFTNLKHYTKTKKETLLVDTRKK